MSEIQSRPARGRSTARGGRGGPAGSRGPRSKQTNGDAASIDTSADDGQLGELKKRHAAHIPILKDMFPGWSDADLVLAIEESDGDLQQTVENISEGKVSQFAEVSKAKDRSRSKVKDVTTDSAPAQRGGARGERTERRGGDSVRGGRGRGTDRGRGGFRGGARGGAAVAPRTAGTGGPSVPTTESPAWNLTSGSTETKENGAAAAEEKPEKPEGLAEKVVEKAAAPVAAAATAAKKTWASMFAAPKPAPAPPKPVAKPPAPAAEEPKQTPAEAAPQETAQEPAAEAEKAPEPPVVDNVDVSDTAMETTSDSVAAKSETTPGTDEFPPTHDELTKDNVEHLPDASHPAPTETAASTVASSRDIGVATPLPAGEQAPIGRPAAGGFAATAMKAAGVATPRSASFQKRLAEQREAVVMPGNHAVDRAAVQFGSLGLSGEESESQDVDKDREDLETKAQPPQHSPVQPRAALPPAPRQSAPAEQPQAQETPKPAPGLPPAPQQQPISQQSPSTSIGAQPAQAQGTQQTYNQFGRYGQSEVSAPQQKPYDAFGQQTPQNQYDYNQQGQQPQSQAGGYSSAPDAFSSQYFTSEQQRSAYHNYYSGYGQQQAPSQQEAGAAQQRTGSAFGTGPSDSSFPTSQQQQTQGRYNEAQNSGHTTPNPALGPTGPGSQGQHMHQSHNQPGHTGSYPYNHPYYGSPYFNAYMNQFGSYGGSYGGFGGKGMYGQPHHYGMSPQSSFDQHSASPANIGGFGQHGRDNGLGGGLNEYGRSVSGTSQSQHGASVGGFDTFSRGQGYGSQSSSYGQQQAGQQVGSDDALKPFTDSKSGPSPSALGAQQGRPGSATQNTPSQGGQGLPPQSHQQGYGGYPAHLQGNQNSQYGGGLGGLGHQGAGSHQQGSYGSYGSYGGGFSGYGNRGGQGGWGTNYGQH